MIPFYSIEYIGYDGEWHDVYAGQFVFRYLEDAVQEARTFYEANFPQVRVVDTEGIEHFLLTRSNTRSLEALDWKRDGF